MRNFIATVKNIESIDGLNILTFKSNANTLKMMSLDLNEDIKLGTKVLLNCKPTAVAIAKNFSGELSYSNQIDATIKSLEVGKLLSSLKLQFEESILESIITTSSLKRMDLKKGERVTALIKSSDLYILEIL
jgi:molybdopterin-binding protein